MSKYRFKSFICSLPRLMINLRGPDGESGELRFSGGVVLAFGRKAALQKMRQLQRSMLLGL